ncbi:hypothetical protein A2U01_0018680, partial [Trifolium medium]|nr:hypothetical protein [Trifolium medium]
MLDRLAGKSIAFLMDILGGSLQEFPAFAAAKSGRKRQKGARKGVFAAVFQPPDGRVLQT